MIVAHAFLHIRQTKGSIEMRLSHGHYERDSLKEVHLTCRSRSIGHACVHVVIMMTRGPEDCINESESTGRSLTSRCSCCTNVVVEKRKRAKKSDKVWLEKQDSSVYTLPVLHPFKAVWDLRDFKPRKCT